MYIYQSQAGQPVLPGVVHLGEDDRRNDPETNRYGEVEAEADFLGDAGELEPNRILASIGLGSHLGHRKRASNGHPPPPVGKVFHIPDPVHKYQVEA